jgi:hypothetical protein
MRKYYGKELDMVSELIEGRTIVMVEHNEDADEGMILTLDSGIKLVFGWSGEQGGCDVIKISDNCEYSGLPSVESYKDM